MKLCSLSFLDQNSPALVYLITFACIAALSPFLWCIDLLSGNLSAFCSYVPELNRELTMIMVTTLIVTCREKFKIEGHHHNRFSQVGIWGNFFD